MNKFISSLAAALLLLPSVASAQFSEATDIDDLALIYIGSQNRPDWTKDKLRPYVVHTYSDGTESWMFDGFLFMDYMMYDEETGIIVGLGEDNAEPSRRIHWERLIDVQFGQADGSGLTALDELIGELIPVLGEPGHKHKVVFNIPVPHKASQIWGSIDGVTMNISFSDDKIKVMKWYADEFLKRWNEAGFKNIELDGVYWTKESFFEDYWSSVIPETNEYFHSLDLNVYWIPYLNARGWDHWKEWGMDVTYIQPGYYFETDRPYSRLPEAANNAWEYGTGLEMEFEGINYGYNTGIKKSYTYTPENCGLYNNSPEFYQRFVTYIDFFEEEGVFDFMPVAYYNGRQAIYDFSMSKNPKDREVIDRLALIMNKRHVESGWDTAPRTTGIADVQLADVEIAYPVAGGIYISDKAAPDVTILRSDGRTVYSSNTVDADSTRLRYGMTVSCSPGVYIVRSGARSIKVAVR